MKCLIIKKILYPFTFVIFRLKYLWEEITRTELPSHVRWYRRHYLTNGFGRIYMAVVNAKKTLCLPFSMAQPHFGFGMKLDNFKDKIVINIGCGIFPHLSPITDTKLKVGIDKNMTAYHESFCDMKRFLGEPHHKIQAKAEFLPFKNDSVDMAMCINAFRYFDWKKALSELKRVLKKNGKVFFSVAFSHSLNNYSPDSLLSFFEKNGFTILGSNNFKKENIEYLKFIVEKPVSSTKRDIVTGWAEVGALA